MPPNRESKKETPAVDVQRFVKKMPPTAVSKKIMFLGKKMAGLLLSLFSPGGALPKLSQLLIRPQKGEERKFFFFRVGNRGERKGIGFLVKKRGGERERGGCSVGDASFSVAGI